MPSGELLAAFLLTTAVFAYVPGPAMLYAAAQTMARGRFAGLMAVLGIHLGCYVHVLAAAAGLSVLFHAVPTLYLVVKCAGAAYLVWLGIAMLRAKADGAGPAQAIQPKSGRRAFFESVTVEVLNPKTAIFFVAFLPQFTDAAASFPIWVQFLILGTIVNLMFSSADLVCVVLASAVVSRLRGSTVIQRLMRRAAGLLLVGLGFRLATQQG
jgi:threonine/homoserine/homoserine lactone efflux protein